MVWCAVVCCRTVWHGVWCMSWCGLLDGGGFLFGGRVPTDPPPPLSPGGVVLADPFPANVVPDPLQFVSVFFFQNWVDGCLEHMGGGWKNTAPSVSKTSLPMRGRVGTQTGHWQQPSRPFAGQSMLSLASKGLRPCRGPAGLHLAQLLCPDSNRFAVLRGNPVKGLRSIVEWVLKSTQGGGLE